MLPVIEPGIRAWVGILQAEADSCGEPVLYVLGVPSEVHGNPSGAYGVRESVASPAERRAVEFVFHPRTGGES